MILIFIFVSPLIIDFHFFFSTDFRYFRAIFTIILLLMLMPFRFRHAICHYWFLSFAAYDADFLMIFIFLSIFAPSAELFR